MANDVQAPEGLDEFLASEPSAPAAPQPTPLPTDTAQAAPASTQVPDVQQPAAAAPEGLDDFLAGNNEPVDRSSFGEQLKTQAEGAAAGIVPIGAPYLEAKANKFLFGTPEEETYKNMQEREAANPGTYKIGEGLGLAGGMLTGTGEGALVAKAGSLVPKLFGEGATLAAKIGVKTAQAGVESALLGANDELTHYIRDNPNASVDGYLAHGGLHDTLDAAIESGKTGAALGYGVAALAPGLGKLAMKLGGAKAAQFLADLRGEVKAQSGDISHAESVTRELSDAVNSTQDLLTPNEAGVGLRQEATEALAPKNITPEIEQYHQDLNNNVQKTIAKLGDTPQAQDLSEALNEYNKVAQGVDGQPAKPSDLFTAADKLKKYTQEEASFDANNLGSEERSYARKMAALSHDLRSGLENEDVWGDAGSVQAELNKAASEYRPALVDLNKKFAQNLASKGQTMDQGKVNTFLNQLGKPTAEIKKDIVDNFIKSKQNYDQAIANAYIKRGLDSPVQPTSLAATQRVMGPQTAGSKFANFLIKDGMERMGGKLAGTVMGAVAGSHFGQTAAGALVGQQIFGPIANKTIHTLMKPILNEASSQSIMEASAMATKAARAYAAIQSTAKNVFNPEMAAPAYAITQQDRDRLSKKIDTVSQNPELLLKGQGQLNSALPGHASAITSKTNAQVQYLNFLKPSTQPALPLDSRVPASKVEQANYNRALDIALKPSIVVDGIKNGRITPTDMIHLQKLYPDQMGQYQQALVKQMSDQMSKGQRVPYQTKQGLSLFLGQPMDSTMLPQNIQSAQPKPTQPGNQAAQGGKAANQGQAKAFKNAGADTMTSTQAAEKDQAKR